MAKNTLCFFKANYIKRQNKFNLKTYAFTPLQPTSVEGVHERRKWPPKAVSKAIALWRNCRIFDNKSDRFVVLTNNQIPLPVKDQNLPTHYDTDALLYQDQCASFPIIDSWVNAGPVHSGAFNPFSNNTVWLRNI